MNDHDVTTLNTLDEAIREHAASEMFGDGEIVVAWLSLAAVRRYDGTGHVVVMPCNGAMPNWEVKGLLVEAIDSIGLLDGGDE